MLVAKWQPSGQSFILALRNALSHLFDGVQNEIKVWWCEKISHTFLLHQYQFHTKVKEQPFHILLSSKVFAEAAPKISSQRFQTLLIFGGKIGPPFYSVVRFLNLAASGARKTPLKKVGLSLASLRCLISVLGSYLWLGTKNFWRSVFKDLPTNVHYLE